MSFNRDGIYLQRALSPLQLFFVCRPKLGLGHDCFCLCSMSHIGVFLLDQITDSYLTACQIKLLNFVGFNSLSYSVAVKSNLFHPEFSHLASWTQV